MFAEPMYRYLASAGIVHFSMTLGVVRPAAQPDDLIVHRDRDEILRAVSPAYAAEILMVVQAVIHGVFHPGKTGFLQGIKP